jgi:hypothetical protein
VVVRAAQDPEQASEVQISSFQDDHQAPSAAITGKVNYRRGDAMMTRRLFVEASAIAAAGMALGIKPIEGLREHGPVDVRTKFLWKDPLLIKANLYSNEDKNIFGLRVFNGGAEHARLEMGLEYVRLIANDQGKKFGTFLAVFDGTGQKEVHRVMLKTDSDRLTIFIEDPDRPGDESMPVWMPLRDVRRVL